MTKWAPWQQWSFGLLVAALVAVVGGAYAQLREDLTRLQQVVSLRGERISALESRVQALESRETLGAEERRRLQERIDRLVRREP